MARFDVFAARADQRYLELLLDAEVALGHARGHREHFKGTGKIEHLDAREHQNANVQSLQTRMTGCDIFERFAHLYSFPEWVVKADQGFWALRQAWPAPQHTLQSEF